MVIRLLAIVVVLISPAVGYAQEVVEAPDRLENAIITFTVTGKTATYMTQSSYVVRENGELEGLWAKEISIGFTNGYRSIPNGTFVYRRLDEPGRAELTLWRDGESDPITKQLLFRSETSAQNMAFTRRVGTEHMSLRSIEVDQPMLNFSNRCEVPPGGSAHSGFVLIDSGQYLVRVVGPTLATFGVETPVSSPMAKVHIVGSPRPESEIEAGRSASAAVHQAAARLVGAFPLPEGSADVAFVAQLRPGAYVIEAQNPTAEAGEVLIEVYALPLP